MRDCSHTRPYMYLSKTPCATQKTNSTWTKSETFEKDENVDEIWYSSRQVSCARICPPFHIDFQKKEGCCKASRRSDWPSAAWLTAKVKVPAQLTVQDTPIKETGTHWGAKLNEFQQNSKRFLNNFINFRENSGKYKNILQLSGIIYNSVK